MRISIRQITSFASRRVKFRFFSGELDETAKVEGWRMAGCGFREAKGKRKAGRVNFDEFNIILLRFNGEFLPNKE